MRTAKLAFAWCFALAALFSLRMGMHLAFVPRAGDSTDIFYPIILVGIPLVVAVQFAVVWWTILQRKPSARKWALSASAVLVEIGLFMIWRFDASFFGRMGILLALGVMGLVLFARREEEQPTTPARPEARPLPGDGTNGLINRTVPLAGAIGAIEGSSHWSGFATAHGLPLHSPAIYLQFLIAVLLVTFFHEAGHALSGVLLKMKLIGFVIGPFRWRMTDGAWHFEFRPAALLAFPAGTAVVPASIDDAPSDFRRRKMVQVAAGPIASLVTGAIAAIAVWMAPGHAWSGCWHVLSYFSTISFVVAGLNIVPFKLGKGYSDGAKLYQLREDGVWSDYHRLLGLIHSTRVLPRPQDLATVHTAADDFVRSHPASDALAHLARSLRESLAAPAI